MSRNKNRVKKNDIINDIIDNTHQEFTKEFLDVYRKL